jgi:hypothetical protein
MQQVPVFYECVRAIFLITGNFVFQIYLPALGNARLSNRQAAIYSQHSGIRW